jgi:hypothetical protein
MPEWFKNASSMPKPIAAESERSPRRRIEFGERTRAARLPNARELAAQCGAGIAGDGYVTRVVGQGASSPARQPRRFHERGPEAGWGQPHRRDGGAAHPATDARS